MVEFLGENSFHLRGLQGNQGGPGSWWLFERWGWTGKGILEIVDSVIEGTLKEWEKKTK